MRALHRTRSWGLGLAWALAWAAALPAAAEDVLYSGRAFGSSVDGPGLHLGQTAVVGLGQPSCSFGDAGLHRENGLAMVDLAPILETGAISTSADSIDHGGSQEARTSATAADVSLLELSVLGPLIVADAVTAVSSTTFDGSVFTGSAAGSGLAGLTVLGLPVLDPAPNTELALPGIGHVVLNEQVETNVGNRFQFTVTMIRVVVEVINELGLPVGTQIVVGQAQSGLRIGSVAGLLSGGAFATQVSVLGTITSGPSARVSLSCLGGLAENDAAGLEVPPLFVVGVAASSARGQVGATQARGQTSVAVGAVDVLAGRITADAIQSVATVDLNGTTISVTDQGSSFTNLTVDGVPIVDVEPNTQISLAGVGTLWLRKVTESPSGIRVVGILVEVLESGLPGVPVGTEILVAAANASVR